MNHVTLIGRVGKQPELRTAQNGKQVASFSLATSERWKDQSGEKQEKTTWHNLVCFAPGLATVIGSYVNKGDMIAVQGKIENRSYEKDGVTKYVSEVIVDQMEMLGSKLDSQPRGDNPPAQQRPVMDDAPSFARDGLDDSVPF